jgi:hypothetical protein
MPQAGCQAAFTFLVQGATRRKPQRASFADSLSPLDFDRKANGPFLRQGYFGYVHLVKMRGHSSLIVAARQCKRKISNRAILAYSSLIDTSNSTLIERGRVKLDGRKPTLPIPNHRQLALNQQKATYNTRSGII